MSAKVRNLSKSKLGSFFLIGFLVLILASFALADLSNFNMGGGANAGTLAQVEDEKITDADVSAALERQLGIVQRTNPEATYADLAGDFEPLLNQLVQERALQIFGEKYGLRVSKRMIDAEIAQLPGATGLDGKLTTESYNAFLASNSLTDAEVRSLVRSDLSQRLLVAAIGAESRVPSTLSRTYASMLLETRNGKLALVPTAPIAAKINPSGQDIADYYQRNQARYTVPEQRQLRIARFDPARFDNVRASDAEIREALAAQEGEIGTREIRVVSQVVVPDQGTANEIVARTATQSFVDAVKPAGFSAADISIGPQSRAEFRALAGEQVADAAFASDVQSGAVVGPVRSPFGWHVVKIDGIETEQGTSEAEARRTAETEITARKRANALVELVADVEDALDGGATLEQVAQRFKLPLTETPLVTATGRARGDTSYAFPADLRPALEIGFDVVPGDDPETVQLGEDAGFALVEAADVVEPAPAPINDIRDRVRNDFVNEQATQRASALGNRVLAQVKAGKSLADAIAAAEKEAGIDFPPIEDTEMRRLDLARFGQEAPAPIQMLFRLSKGNSRLVADPEGRGVFIVQLVSTKRGNALSDPQLIQQVSQSFLAPLAGELQQQFVTAVREEIGVKRNEAQIKATRDRIVGGAADQ